ncbi:MAG: T9SS type A sorting domain-containing protein, partial [candidate division WOR-3 bacterium]
FGASLAWWFNSLSTHYYRGEIYNYLFKELGLDILRLRNIYGKEDYAMSVFEEIADSFYSLSDNEPKIMISSWSPPVDLKSNNNIVGGTLDTTASGEYVYGDFAQYWIDALDAFEEAGIVPDYISIQNEPDWGESHETCRFEPTETSTYAGYDQALDSVYRRFQELSSPPKILAPEVLGIGYNHFQNYANQFNHDHADGYAYHLYHGGDGNVNPDAFNENLSAIANSYSDKPIFQSEYDIGGWFNTVWLMHNCLVHGNVSGYFYWTIVSTNLGSQAFVVLDGYQYILSQAYWGFRQYSKAIHHGWKRVGAEVDADSLLISAFIGPENDELSVVVINISHESDSLDLSVPNFDISGANIIRSSDTEQCALVSYYNGTKLNLPARSITTISTLEISPGSAGIKDKKDIDSNTVDCFLAQNHPNPFNRSTTIEYSISKESFVFLAIYDNLGRKIKTLVEEIKPSGKHTINIELNELSSGIYFYRLETSGKTIQKKMLLIK